MGITVPVLGEGGQGQLSIMDNGREIYHCSAAASRHYLGFIYRQILHMYKCTHSLLVMSICNFICLFAVDRNKKKNGQCVSGLGVMGKAREREKD